jgi:hypothetical protein
MKDGVRWICKLGVFSATVTIAACATTTDVVPYGPDTFIVGTESMWIFHDQAELQVKAAQQANVHCAGMGREMVPMEMKSQPIKSGGLLSGEAAQFGAARFIFKCLQSDDAQNHDPRIQPDQVIERRDR